jgi:hypothetical protein
MPPNVGTGRRPAAPPGRLETPDVLRSPAKQVDGGIAGNRARSAQFLAARVSI